MILVVGGAGYVGSHVAKALRKEGWEHRIIDNLENGHVQAVGESPFQKADLRDPASLRAAMNGDAEDLMIFSGYISVGESYRNPQKYYANNVAGILNLLDAAVEQGVQRIVFSSTAAVYGQPDEVPIRESCAKAPTNPYGETKWAIERALHWYSIAHGIRCMSLRYFNAAGADIDGELGEDHDPEEHLIPIAIDAALKRREPMTLFGTDYPTPDGTCIRDFVHVDDLASAHLAALKFLGTETGDHAINLGSGTGFSVKEVIDVVSEVAEADVPFQLGDRRLGDPARLVASNELAKSKLGWNPVHTDLKTIVRSAYNWRVAHPNGYGDS